MGGDEETVERPDGETDHGMFIEGKYGWKRVQRGACEKLEEVGRSHIKGGLVSPVFTAHIW